MSRNEMSDRDLLIRIDERLEAHMDSCRRTHCQIGERLNNHGARLKDVESCVTAEKTRWAVLIFLFSAILRFIPNPFKWGQ